MLGRTLRPPSPPGLPARPLSATTRALPPLAARSVAAAGCNQFKGLGPHSRRGEPGSALSPRKPAGGGCRWGNTVGVKGSEAGGGGAFSTGDGLGSAEAWWPGSRRPRQASALARRPHLRWSWMVRGEGRWWCLLAGLPLTSSTWKGERGWAHICRNTIFVANLKRLSGGSALSLSPVSSTPSWVLFTNFPAAAGARV